MAEVLLIPEQTTAGTWTGYIPKDANIQTIPAIESGKSVLLEIYSHILDDKAEMPNEAGTGQAVITEPKYSIRVAGGTNAVITKPETVAACAVIMQY